MQGKKNYQEKLFNSFQLSVRVPEHNFYRRLKDVLPLDFPYKETTKRQSTVEPVFGTLPQFMGLRKVNTIGIKQANKCMHLSAMAYNLKKYLKFIQKRTKSGGGMPCFIVF
ncbi:MAG: transposase [Xanthomarina gelatinilytica]|nr:transposase [Xanthomarina gelatinilytica]